MLMNKKRGGTRLVPYIWVDVSQSVGDDTCSRMQTLKILTALLILGTANCYIFNSTVQMKDGKCVYGKSLREDNEDWYNPDFCERMTCLIRDNKAYIVVTDCGVPSSPNPNCKIKKGEGNYPDCCPKIICD